MAEIDWSILAKTDLQDIYDYISKDSARYALRMIDRIVSKAEILNLQPKVGKVVKEFDDNNLRELLEGNYRIIYYVDFEQKVFIVRVFHGARLLKLDNL